MKWRLPPLSRCRCWTALFDTADAEWPEILADAGSFGEWSDLARRGGYPIPTHALADPEARALWFSGFTQTYLERDLRDLTAAGSLVDFRRLPGRSPAALRGQGARASRRGPGRHPPPARRACAPRPGGGAAEGRRSLRVRPR